MKPTLSVDTHVDLRKRAYRRITADVALAFTTYIETALEFEMLGVLSVRRTTKIGSQHSAIYELLVNGTVLLRRKYMTNDEGTPLSLLWEKAAEITDIDTGATESE